MIVRGDLALWLSRNMTYSRFSLMEFRFCMGKIQRFSVSATDHGIVYSKDWAAALHFLPGHGWPKYLGSIMVIQSYNTEKVLSQFTG